MSSPMKTNTSFPITGAHAIKLADLSAVSSGGIVSRTLLQSPELRLIHFVFDEGQELTGHTSTHRALVHVLEGACDFLFNDEWKRLEAGTILHMEPKHPHAVKASYGAFSMTLTLGMNPAGKDTAPAAPKQA